ncbi:hypothetical protein [Shewanella salipaludis]|uniref:Uncharacterized protein n=1 Tax=Shewanella salipaludis TaxID=2723052 RepID=A0A972FUL2_9GAMM|nr:hypothetical protein [Shewanella salipaludis]NMH65937.1 hypothetical protein [Shewanella salipaludis]
MDELVFTIATKVAEHYGKMLTKFRPARPGSEYLEQNLITLFGHQYLLARPDGAFFSEVPFMGKNSERGWPNRLDAFAFCGDTGYLIEAKGIGENPANIAKVVADLERLNSPQLQDSLDIMFKDRSHVQPNQIKKLVLADCWKKEIADSWQDPSGKLIEDAAKVEIALSTKSIHIGTFNKYHYYLLIAQVMESAQTCHAE